MTRHSILLMLIVSTLCAAFAFAACGSPPCDSGTGGSASASSSGAGLPPCINPGKCEGTDPTCTDPGPCLAGVPCNIEICAGAVAYRCPDDAPDCAAPSGVSGCAPIAMGGATVAYCCGSPTCVPSSSGPGSGAGGSGPGCVVTPTDDATCVALGADGGPMSSGPTPVPYCLTVCMPMSGCVPEPGAGVGHYCCPD